MVEQYNRKILLITQLINILLYIIILEVKKMLKSLISIKRFQQSLMLIIQYNYHSDYGLISKYK
jgi:hypothetical protein